MKTGHLKAISWNLGRFQSQMSRKHVAAIRKMLGGYARQWRTERQRHKRHLRNERAKLRRRA